MEENPWETSQPVKEFPALYGTWRFITTFTRACQLWGPMWHSFYSKELTPCPTLLGQQHWAVPWCPHITKMVDLPLRKVISFLQPIKDDLSFKTPGVYRISCECGKVYIRQIGHSIKHRIKEHHWNIRLYHPDKSGVAKYSTNLGYCIQFQDTISWPWNPDAWNTSSGSDGVWVHPNNMNNEDGFSLS